MTSRLLRAFRRRRVWIFVFVQADPAEREQLSNQELLKEGIEFQTLWFRAPEVLFGDQTYGFAVDSWSLGVVLAELGGFRFWKVAKTQRYTQVDYCVALFEQLGTPTTDRLRNLPHWPALAPRFPRKPWSGAVWSALGLPGVNLLEELLVFDPSLRMGVAAAAAHEFVLPERFGLGGRFKEEWGFVLAASPSFEGARHPWNVLEGSVAPEVVRWLQGDPALLPGSDEHKALDISFTAARENVKCEEGRKFVRSGHTGACSTTAMCGLSLKHELPLPRVLSWLRAFKSINAAPLAILQATARHAVSKMAEADRKQNGTHFLESPFEEWFLTCAEMSVLNAGGKGEFWSEPVHQDGGASVLHMGLTLFGRRQVRFEQGPLLPDVWVPCGPGSVYLGQVTGARHQVPREGTTGSSQVVASVCWHLCICIAMFI